MAENESAPTGLFISLWGETGWLQIWDKIHVWIENISQQVFLCSSMKRMTHEGGFSNYHLPDHCACSRYRLNNAHMNIINSIMCGNVGTRPFV